mmetsp:Transcript_71928/g.200784  ORF Transcript_71928/g.200784 Transcript_71928/m.200784 type:complete len:353 (-) Transcript_71928:327-1385(-)
MGQRDEHPWPDGRPDASHRLAADVVPSRRRRRRRRRAAAGRHGAPGRRLPPQHQQQRGRDRVRRALREVLRRRGRPRLRVLRRVLGQAEGSEGLGGRHPGRPGPGGGGRRRGRAGGPRGRAARGGGPREAAEAPAVRPHQPRQASEGHRDGAGAQAPVVGARGAVAAAQGRAPLHDRQHHNAELAHVVQVRFRLPGPEAPPDAQAGEEAPAGRRWAPQLLGPLLHRRGREPRRIPLARGQQQKWKRQRPRQHRQQDPCGRGRGVRRRGRRRGLRRCRPADSPRRGPSRPVPAGKRQSGPRLRQRRRRRHGCLRQRARLRARRGLRPGGRADEGGGHVDRLQPELEVRRRQAG